MCMNVLKKKPKVQNKRILQKGVLKYTRLHIEISKNILKLDYACGICGTVIVLFFKMQLIAAIDKHVSTTDSPQ